MLSQTDQPAQTPETSDTDTTSSANEITPLRRSQDVIAGDTPTLVSIRSSKSSKKMDNNKRILFKLAIDFFLLCCGELKLLFFLRVLCDDLSIWVWVDSCYHGHCFVWEIYCVRLSFICGSISRLYFYLIDSSIFNF